LIHKSPRWLFDGMSIRPFLIARSAEPQDSLNDVLRHVIESALATEGVCTQAYERIGHTDTELHGHFSSGDVDHEVKLTLLFECVRYGTWRSASLYIEHPRCHDVGHERCVGKLDVAQRTRSISVKVQRSKPDGSQSQRKREDGLYTRLDGPGSECEPPSGSGIDQIRLEDDLATMVGVNARTFSQRELQLLDQCADVIGATQRSLVYVVGHHHNSDARYIYDLRSFLAQPLRYSVAVAS
jgi:hypothetical protein